MHEREVHTYRRLISTVLVGIVFFSLAVTTSACVVAEELWWYLAGGAWAAGLAAVAIFCAWRRDLVERARGFWSAAGPPAFNVVGYVLTGGSWLGVMLFCATLWFNEAGLDSPVLQDRMLVEDKGVRINRSSRDYWVRVRHLASHQTFILRRSTEYGPSYVVGELRTVYFRYGRLGWIVPIG